jgi:predicted CoA-binding protein
MPTIAILGASTDRRKFGNRCVRAFQALGYTVYPINPREREIEGLPVYPDLQSVPISEFDLVSVYLGRDLALSVLTQLPDKPIGELWLNPGADHPDVIARAEELKLNVKRGCSIISYGTMPEEF